MAEGLCTWTAGKHREEPSDEAQGPGATVSGLGAARPRWGGCGPHGVQGVSLPTLDYRLKRHTINMWEGEKIAQRGWRLRGRQRERKRRAMGKKLEEATALGSVLCLKPALPSGDLCPSPDLRPLVYDQSQEVLSLFWILQKV